MLFLSDILAIDVSCSSERQQPIQNTPSFVAPVLESTLALFHRAGSTCGTSAIALNRDQSDKCQQQFSGWYLSLAFPARCAGRRSVMSWVRTVLCWWHSHHCSHNGFAAYPCRLCESQDVVMPAWTERLQCEDAGYHHIVAWRAGLSRRRAPRRTIHIAQLRSELSYISHI